MSSLKIKRLKPFAAAQRRPSSDAAADLTGMACVTGGVFLMGSDRHYPEETPARSVSVRPFWMDETPVTNASFAEFVAATGYVTFAERTPNAQDYPGADPALLRAGSAVFQKPDRPVPLDDPSRWWAFVVGACWRRPLGPGSSTSGIEQHPVAHVVHEDAAAYARWAGKRLPTEAEWEFAARGGLIDQDYGWGDAFEPNGAPQANYWQGDFPWQDLKAAAGVRTSPVKSYPSNAFGLYDLIGNVWEITDDWFTATPARPPTPCCVVQNPGGPELSDDQAKLGRRKVMKGGSHLCAPNYCRRYRPAARYPHLMDTSTGHVGFRCVADAVADPSS